MAQRLDVDACEHQSHRRRDRDDEGGVETESAAGKGADVSIRWLYDDEDDTMKELGEEFGEDVEHAKFELQPMSK